MISKVKFQEAAAERPVVSLPLSHLSIELGHLYAEDFGPGYDNLQRHLDHVAPWVDRARHACEAQLPEGVKPRVSTCYLIDDYFNRFSNPPEVLEVLQKAAQASGLTIDYIAREAACVEADQVRLAELVVDHLVSDPPPHTTGSRPEAKKSGWLCNGQRTPDLDAAPAMKAPAVWTPPAQNGANPHSIFVDVELWSDRRGQRTWSCSFLASVWQLVRLGLLRHSGDAVVHPYLLDDEPVPGDWDKLPAVIQLNPKAAPFSAYRTVSVLKSQFLPVELAVRTILSQVSVEPGVAEELARRSQKEGIELPRELIERIGYVFISD